jgi:hypothetical protein
MTTIRSIGLFALAALAEIGGAWLVWQGVREHRGLVWVGTGFVALGLYGLVATRQPSSEFGRVLERTAGSSSPARSPAASSWTASSPTQRLHRRRHLPGRRRHHHVRPPA